MSNGSSVVYFFAALCFAFSAACFGWLATISFDNPNVTLVDWCMRATICLLLALASAAMVGLGLWARR